MSNYFLNTSAGNTFKEVAKKAKELTKNFETVEFDFNGIKCLVNKKTVPDWLERDYMNAFTMEWKTVGPDCEAWYDVDTEIELYSRKLKEAQESKERLIKQRAKDDLEDQKIQLLIKDIPFEIIPGKEKEYSDYVNKNSGDGYSKAVIQYGEIWARLMQIEIASGKPVRDIADNSQKGLGYLGISGFQYGCAVRGLSHFWIHGEELRKWHNKEYGHEGEGVVNPAVITIK